MDNKHVPEYMRNAFAANGVNAKGLLFAVHTDMTARGDFSDTYVAVDTENLYILYGIEEVVKTEGARRIVSQYTMREVVTHSLKELAK